MEDSKKSVFKDIVKAPTGSYPKLWRLLDHYFLKDEVPDRFALQALDTIVDINNAILEKPKSANNRAVRSSEPRIRNLIQTGGTDIMTAIGWKFKVMRMEECWVLPYDADLEALRINQEKIIETQQKVALRMEASNVVRNKMKQETEEKARILRTIEQDKKDREAQRALRAGAPVAPTQSLEEVRRQANQERMERERQRKAKAAVEAAQAGHETQSTSSLPGSFPARDPEEDLEADLSSMRSSDQIREHLLSMRPDPHTREHLHHEAQPKPLRKRYRAPKPIQVKKPVVKQTYQATENRLGGEIALDEVMEEYDDDLYASDD